MLNVAIIGAGPAALAAAISIAKHCPSSEVNIAVYEARGSFQEHVGVQYTFTYLGLNALDILGIRDKAVSLVGHPNSRMWCVDACNGESRKVEFSMKARDEGFVHFERVRFIELLGQELASYDIPVHFNKRLVSHDPTSNTIMFKDGTSVRADLLIGADGIYSAVRSIAIDSSIEPIRTGGAGCYLCVDVSDIMLKQKEQRADVEQKILDFSNGSESVFSWGLPATFGLFSLGNNRLCFFYNVTEELQESVFNGKLRTELTPEEHQGIVLRLAESHRSDLGPHPCAHLALLPAIIMRLHLVPGRDFWDIKYLPILERTYSENGVIIIGDAAHAVPPSVGMGAQSSVEDGAFLGLALRDRFFSPSSQSLPEVLHEFSETRKLVVHSIQRLSQYANTAYMRNNANVRLPILFRPPATLLERISMVYQIVWGSLWGVSGVKDLMQIPGNPGVPRPTGMRVYVPHQI